MMFRFFIFIISLGAFYSCSSSKTNDTSFVIQVNKPDLDQDFSDCAALSPDTLRNIQEVEVFNKAVQRYASALLCVHSYKEKSDIEIPGVSIQDAQGNPVSLNITQEQRDSVIMEFIKFARRSEIPYQDKVKNFELKMMSIR